MSSTAVMGWEVSEINEAIQKAIKLSATDSSFRKLALTDPNAAIERVAGKPVPAGTRIRFVENAGAHFTIILPDMARSDASELSDEELEQVAGGGRCAATCAASCAVTSTVTIGIPSVGSIVSI
jgi:hypothetical protein